jgi:hypothetical protein
MNLHELPRNTEFTVNAGTLLNYPEPPVYTLHHIDGMYSVCYDKDNNLIHFSAFTPVTPIEGK